MPSMPTDLMPINEWGARARASCRTNLHSGLEDFIQDIIEIIGSEKVLLKQQARKHRREARPRPGFIQRFRHVLFWDMRLDDCLLFFGSESVFGLAPKLSLAQLPKQGWGSYFIIVT